LKFMCVDTTPALAFMNLVALFLSVCFSAVTAHDALMLLQQQVKLHQSQSNHECVPGGPLYQPDLAPKYNPPMQAGISKFPPTPPGGTAKAWTDNECDVVVGDLCYKLFQNGTLDFCSEEAVCKAHGGTLATLQTQNQRAAVAQFLADAKLTPGFGSNTWAGPDGGACVRVGAYNIKNGDWEWADGTPSTGLYVHRDSEHFMPVGHTEAQNCSCIIDKPCSWSSGNLTAAPPGSSKPLQIADYFGDCQIQDFPCQTKNTNVHSLHDDGWDGLYFLCSMEIDNHAKDSAAGLDSVWAISFAVLLVVFQK